MTDENKTYLKGWTDGFDACLKAVKAYHGKEPELLEVTRFENILEIMEKFDKGEKNVNTNAD